MHQDAELGMRDGEGSQTTGHGIGDRRLLIADFRLGRGQSGAGSLSCVGVGVVGAERFGWVQEFAYRLRIEYSPDAHHPEAI